MSLTSTAIAYIVGRLVLQRYKEYLEAQNWPYVAIQREVDRGYVARHYRQLRENRTVASDDNGESAGLVGCDRPVVRVGGVNV